MKDLRFEHGGAKLVSCPRRHLTSLRPAHHDCLAKMAKFVTKIRAHQWQTINHKLFKTKCCSVDYRSTLTIENNLKVEKRYIISKTSTIFPKKRLGYA